MSCSTCACYADTVETEFVAEKCPEQYKAFMDYIGTCEEDIDAVAYWLDEYMGLDGSDNLTEEQEAEIRELYFQLCEEFEKQVELPLEIRYFEKQDRGDEVNGAFWEVQGVYQFTPEAEKVKDKIERKFWTTFG